MEGDLVPRAEWRQSLTWFTAAHQGWLITVDAAPAGAEPVCLMRDVPLVGVFDEPDRLLIVGGRHGDRVERTLEHPTRLRTPTAPGGAAARLDVETEAGEQVHVRFRSAMTPELVDGV